MKFSVEQDDNIVIFTLKETRLDSQKTGDLKAEFLILCQPNVEAFIIDLSSVEYCDSAGLGTFLLAQRLMNEHAAPVVLVGVQESVMRLLNLSHIVGSFLYFNTVSEALHEIQDDDIFDETYDDE